MTKIQIILLFAPLEALNESMRGKAKEIVTEEYCQIYACGPEQLQVSLCSGTSTSQKSNDIVLSIAADKKMLNEGSLRNSLKSAVANRFMLLFPSSMGFRGTIGTMDGQLEVPAEAAPAKQNTGDGEDYTARAGNYRALDPVFTFDMLKLPESTMDQIEQALARIEYEREVFEEWGLYAIMPSPICAMSFYGPPGTGKTLAAEAIASKLKKKLIRASYADIESKYHGEGPKNVGAIFLAAEQQDAVLFIDEADSLLSKRLTNVSQGSEQAINSMRSQLLICLEKFHGVVIFATNLVVNYDRAFVSRLISVKFELPDPAMREEIWRAHLYPNEQARVKLNIPLAEDVDLKELAERFPVCGRDIRNSVVNACVAAKRQGMRYVTQDCLVRAVQVEMQRQENVLNAEDHTDAYAAKKQQATSVSKLLATTIETTIHTDDGKHDGVQ